MDEHHKPVPWDKSTAASLPADLRAGLANLWRARMISEHRSVGIFSLYALDLLGSGAPAEVLSLACRAALDEVRHAELFARVTELYSGKPETPPPGIPPMPDDPGVPMMHQVAREALHLGVSAETFSAASLVELHERASDPAVKGVLGVVISDEIFHARMGWSFIHSLLDGPNGDELKLVIQDEIVPMFDGYVADMFGDASKIPEPSLSGDALALATAHGYMSARDEYAVFRAVIDDVWIPGLAGLGLDPSGLRGRYQPV